LTKQPIILANRYALQLTPRVGGMAKVYPASDISEAGKKVAVKIFERGSLDEEIITEAFSRELRALKELQHSSIVQLLDWGKDSSERPFLVLEWCEHDLSTYAEIVEGWDDFYQNLGRPILDALAFAHSRQLAHRDVKPANILVSSAGQPKLSDFSISKLKTWLEPGVTLGEFKTVPFSPPESDDDSHSFTRDVFGFAVLALDSLSDVRLLQYEDVAKALDSLDVVAEVHELLRQCLSTNPEQRPRDARILLAKFDEIQETRRVEWERRECIYLELSQKALTTLRTEFPSAPKDEIQSQLLDDLNSVCGIRPYTRESQEAVEGHYVLLGANYSCHVAIAQNSPFFIIHGVRKLSASLLERQREDVFSTNHRFLFGRSPNEINSRRILLQLQEQIEISQQNLIRKVAERKEQQLFNAWSALLKAKSDLERRKEQPIKYRGFSIKGNRIVFRLGQPVEDPIVGQQRKVKEGKTTFVSGEVEDVSGDSLTLYVPYRLSVELPQQGHLSIDTAASMAAIERQKMALDAVRYDRALRSDLRELIVHPETNSIPVRMDGLTHFHDELDEAKRLAVGRALGSDSFLVVEGQPGTGKTTFIAELVLQELKRNPKARILLSSQTHVALDNALDKIRVKNPAVKMVRIGRSDNPRIAPEIGGLLLENQIDSWRDDAISRGQRFLEKYAKENGFSLQQLKTGEQLNRLSVLTRELTNLDSESERRRTELAEFLEADPLTPEQQGRLRSVPSEEVVVMRDDLERLARERSSKEKERKVLSEELKKDDLAKELLEFSPEEIASWAKAFFPDSTPSARVLRDLLDVQAEWAARFGRSADFHPALVNACQVIAGTCVGIAGIKGLQDLEFDLCIVDEASKATPTETLVPISRSQRWVLVGDKRQLPPFIEEGLLDDQLLARYALDRQDLAATLFDRLCDLLPVECRTSLTWQHRMVPGIGNLISQCFYDGELKSAPKAEDDTFSSVLPRPVTWLSTSSRLDKNESAAEMSFRNLCESQVITELLRRMGTLAENRNRRYKVAVLTGYAEQKKLLERTFAPYVEQHPRLQLEWNTVDAFQGREADVAIYSVTRSNPSRKLGFLKENRRLNVALSRGRYYLVLVGDIHFAREIDGENPFGRVIQHIELNPNECCIRDFK
jgi:superfamily I DNA and/or RNA helicase/serine/threonine protein kinase